MKAYLVSHDGPIHVGQPVQIHEVTLKEAISLEKAFSLLTSYKIVDMEEED